MTNHQFEISFAQIECTRCHGVRIRGVVCPDCGKAPAPWEVDVKLQRRQAVVAELLVAATGTDPESRDTFEIASALDLPSAIAPMLPDFLGALQIAVKSDFREVDALRDAVCRYAGLREAAQALSPRRPFGKPNELSQEIVEHLGHLIEEYLGAFAARTPLEAQARAESGQRILDQLADIAGQLNDWLDRQTTVDETNSVAEAISSLLSYAAEAAGVETLLGLASHHQAELVKVLGGPVEPGIAVMFAMQSSIAGLFLDPKSYAGKLRLAAELFGTSGGTLDALLRAPAFQEDLHRLELDLFDSAVQCQHAIATATVPRQAAKAIVALNKSLVEAAGRVVAAPVLVAAGAKSKPYAKLRHDNATELIDLVRTQTPFGDLVAGLDPHLRTAESHSAVTYGDDFLTTDLAKKSRTYGYDDLADATFEAWESCLAVMLGVRHAMAAQGVVHIDEAGLRSLGLTPQEIVAVCLEAFGAALDSATLTDGHLHLEAGSLTPSGVSVALAGTLAALNPSDVTSISLITADGQRWSIPASAYRNAYDRDDEFEGQLAVVRIQREWRNDLGRSWLSDEAIRKWSAVHAGEALGLGTRQKFARLAALRRLAVDLGDAEWATTLKRLTTVVRLQEQGQRPTDQEASSLQTLQSWIGRDVDVALL